MSYNYSVMMHHYYSDSIPLFPSKLNKYNNCMNCIIITVEGGNEKWVDLWYS